MKEIDSRLINDYEEAIEEVEKTKSFLLKILDEEELKIVFEILNNFTKVSREKINAIKNFYKK